MHAETLQFVMDEARFPPPKSVLEIGGLNVNGHVRNLILHKSWHSVDIVAGPLVDEVADAADWTPPQSYDLVLCLEVFEHTKRWREIIGTICDATDPDGKAVITCAIEPRPAHGAYGAHFLAKDEWYQNPDDDELEEVLRSHFRRVQVSKLPRGDFRAVCWH